MKLTLSLTNEETMALLAAQKEGRLAMLGVTEVWPSRPPMEIRPDPQFVVADGKKVRKLREMKAVSQARLAEKAGVSVRTVIRSESYKKITSWKLDRIAAALDEANPQQLLSKDNDILVLSNFSVTTSWSYSKNSTSDHTDDVVERLQQLVGDNFTLDLLDIREADGTEFDFICTGHHVGVSESILLRSFLLGHLQSLDVSKIYVPCHVAELLSNVQGWPTLQGEAPIMSEDSREGIYIYYGGVLFNYLKSRLEESHHASSPGS